MCPELTTAALRSSQATHAAVDNSASIQPARSLFISWGKTVQTSGATSIGFAVDSFLRKGDARSSGPGMGYMISTFVLDIVLGFAAAMVVAWFSRHREFRADAGSAQLLGRKQPMINALARLGGMQPGELPKSVAAFGISGGIGQLFSTHPPLEERIAALQNSQV